MLDLVPLLLMRDSRALRPHCVRLPNVLGLQVAISGEECIAASIRARGKSVAVFSAEFREGRKRCAVIPAEIVLLVAIKGLVIKHRDRFKAEGRIVFNTYHGRFGVDQRLEKPIVIAIYIDREDA